MKLIESKSNPLIKKITALKSPSVRKEENLFVIEGLKSVLEIPQDWITRTVFLSQSFCQAHEGLEQSMPAECIVVPDPLLKQLADTVTPQGILAVVQKKSFDQAAFFQKTKDAAFYIACEAVQDPGNLGAIVRTAAAAGVDGIFLSPDCVDLFNPKVLRATMGSIFQLPIFCDVDLPSFAKEAAAEGIHTIATHLNGAVSPYGLDLKAPVVFFTGNEANGLTDTLAHACKTRCKLPILRQTESLNAAVATGIFIYEALRQRASV